MLWNIHEVPHNLKLRKDVNLLSMMLLSCRGVLFTNGQFSMGEEKMSKINIYILNFFCDVSRAQLNGEFSSKNETEKK